MPPETDCGQPSTRLRDANLEHLIRELDREADMSCAERQALQAADEWLQAAAPPADVTNSVDSTGERVVIADGTHFGPVLSYVRSDQNSRQAPRPTSEWQASIYLSDGASQAEVEAAVERALHTSGIEVLTRDEPAIGSWFRTVRALLVRSLLSDAAR